MKNTDFYHDPAMEAELRTNVISIAKDPNRGLFSLPLLNELDLIRKAGKTTLFAIIAKLVDFSLERGYPLSFRGNVGNLLVAHAIGLSQNTPYSLDLPYGHRLSSASRIPHITLNVAHGIYPELMDYLKGLLPEGTVLTNVPDQPDYRVFIVPNGSFDPSKRYLCFDVFCHILMDAVGNAARTASRKPLKEDVISPEFIQEVWQEELKGDLILEDLLPLREYAPDVEPLCMDDLIRFMGLSLAPELWDQTDEEGFALFDAISTREDIFFACIMSAQLSDDLALEVMDKVGRGQADQLDTVLRELLSDAGLLEQFDAIGGLYPTCQCAEYLTFALVLAWLRRYG